jgi:hypothetical protein
MIFLACLIFLFIPTAGAQRLSVAAPELTRAEIEEFLLKATIGSERRMLGQVAWRVRLDDGKRKHDAGVETEDGTTPTLRNYRFNVAAYEMDKALDLNLVPPSVVRPINGRLASVSWWVDDVAMVERDRRNKKIEPPDSKSWDEQMQAVRLFDELISNPYRNLNPENSLSTSSDNGPAPDYAWGELLITRQWRIWLIDHTGSFRTRRQLQHPETLRKCDRTLLSKLRGLNQDALKPRLGKYLAPEQLDALESRRELLVKHFSSLIAAKGESAVLYDLPARP